MMSYYGWHIIRPHQFWGFGPVFGILFWIFIFLLVISIVKGNSKDDNVNEDRNGETNNALEILKERYAKGDISNHEFEKMKKEIQ